MAKRAKLDKDEVLALRLYTGPLYKKYNGKMRKIGEIIAKQQKNENNTDAAFKQGLVVMKTGKAIHFVVVVL